MPLSVKTPLLLFLLLAGFTACAQTGETYTWLSDSVTIRAIDRSRAYAQQELDLQLGDDFYAWETDSLTGHIQVRAVAGMYCYVYAWNPRTKRSPLDGAFRYFGNNEKAARRFEDSLKTKGYETMLYKTAGTSAAKITTRMLQYNAYSLQYIILHEAVHRHRGHSGSKLPYIFEEALCDVVASRHVPVLLGWNHTIATDSLGGFHRVNEALHKALYEAVTGKIPLHQCDMLVKNLLRKGDLFQNDRFGYTVNHAYLERYTSYCKYYFLLQRAYDKAGSWKNFSRFVFSLEGSEREVRKKLERWTR